MNIPLILISLFFFASLLHSQEFFNKDRTIRDVKSPGEIRRLNFRTGDFDAVYSFANSDMSHKIMKQRIKKYRISGELITDELLSQDSKFLGTYSYGYNIYKIAFGGPAAVLSDKIKFHIDVEKRFLRDSNPSGFAYKRLIMDDEGNPLDIHGNPITFYETDTEGKRVLNFDMAYPYDFYGEEGEYLPYQWDEQGPWPGRSSSHWSWNGDLTLDFQPVFIRIGGYSRKEKQRRLAGFAPGVDFHNVLDGAGIGFSLWNSDNNPVEDYFRDSYYLRLTHTLNPSTYYTAQLNYSSDSFERSSIQFGDKFWNAGDTKNDDIGAKGPNGDGLWNPAIIQTGIRPHADLRSAALFASYGTQPGLYWKQSLKCWDIKVDATHKPGKSHELKAGMEFSYHTYRNYAIGNYGFADLNEMAGDLARVGGDFTVESVYQSFFVDPIGYDLFGNETNEAGRNNPKHPVVAAAYLQDRFAIGDLFINAGFRVDYFDAVSDYIVNPEQITTFRTETGTIELKEENFKAGKAYVNFSPRFGFSLPVTNSGIFHAHYEKFVQTPELSKLYVSTVQYAQNLQSGNYFTIENANLSPVRTTMYEGGFRQQLGFHAVLDVTAFYKKIWDYIRFSNLESAVPVPYAIYQNHDSATIKGLTVSFRMHRTKRITASANYTLQSMENVWSETNSVYNIAWRSENDLSEISPFEFEQRHSGSFNIDYRFTDNDGPMIMGTQLLSNSGIDVLCSFGSGITYTPVRVQTEVLGGTSGYFPSGEPGSKQGPWIFQVDVKIGKTFTFAGVSLNTYLWVINLFNKLNATYVYPGTGEPDDDGYLTSEAGQNFVSTWGPNGVELYKFLLRTPHMVGPPRQIRIGFRFDI